MTFDTNTDCEQNSPNSGVPVGTCPWNERCMFQCRMRRGYDFPTCLERSREATRNTMLALINRPRGAVLNADRRYNIAFNRAFNARYSYRGPWGEPNPFDRITDPVEFVAWNDGVGRATRHLAEVRSAHAKRLLGL